MGILRDVVELQRSGSTADVQELANGLYEKETAEAEESSEAEVQE
ncbi:hypothetical protein [Bacillus manliponensis]|nr:hypothetical protein [Bacillus manliponensis]